MRHYNRIFALLVLLVLFEASESPACLRKGHRRPSVLRNRDSDRIRKARQEAAIEEFRKQGGMVYTADDAIWHGGITLALEARHLTDANMRRLADMPGLMELKFGGGMAKRTQPTDAQLVHLRKLTQLRVLVLSNTFVTDEGFAHLAGLKNLEHLDLGYSRVTYNGLARLIRQLPKLKWLYIDENWQVSLEQVRMLERMRPGCTVIR
ncbi:MAG: hypothetical protein IH991_03940 [Planctomycetes bacterium]|nr:hypothetical protein [Planctomycetota bacterium]